MTSYAELMFTPDVQAEQDKIGSKGKYDRHYGERGDAPLGPREAAFIAARDSVYIASVNSAGWPYIQHRGGPAGFVKLLDDRTLCFADYLGNRQLITKGNLAGDNRVSVFAMDYANKARMKLQGHATLVEAEHADPALLEALDTQGQGRVQRVMTIRIAVWDWNCPQFITPRFNTSEMTALIGPELSRLEQANAALKAEIAKLRTSK